MLGGNPAKSVVIEAMKRIETVALPITPEKAWTYTAVGRLGQCRDGC